MRVTLHLALAVIFMTITACEKEKAATAPQSSSMQLTVFAAASATDVMREAGRRFEVSTGAKVVFSFDSSSNLARQIKLGSPADVFISADEQWMDDVAAAGAIIDGSRENLLANELVVIAPVGKEFTLELKKDFDFAGRLPGVQRVAVGDPAHVPAGRYARQALDTLGWWSVIEPRLIPAQDVRAALRLVETREADAGIVYSTDVRHSSKVVVVASFPSHLHKPIRYPIALCRQSPAGVKFISFLRSAEMTEVFQKAGFTVLSAPRNGTKL